MIVKLYPNFTEYKLEFIIDFDYIDPSMFDSRSEIFFAKTSDWSINVAMIFVKRSTAPLNPKYYHLGVPNIQYIFVDLNYYDEWKGSLNDKEFERYEKIDEAIIPIMREIKMNKILNDRN